MKQSTVAAIAASNLMMFTGLVNAEGTHPSPAIPVENEPTTMIKCNVKKTKSEIQYTNNTEDLVYLCTADKSCVNEITRGKMTLTILKK